jgi:hypothetical protein
MSEHGLRRYEEPSFYYPFEESFTEEGKNLDS